MAVHMIIGVTVGSEKIIETLERRGAAYIFVLDEDHEGPPVDVGRVTYYSTEDAINLHRRYPGLQLHYYRNKFPVMNLDRFEFRG